MHCSQVHRRVLTAGIIAVGLGIATSPAAMADTENSSAPNDPITSQAIPGPVTGDVATDADADPAAVNACGKFASALDFASVNYADFADAISGNRATVNYAAPEVRSTNVSGRTALREAAALAMKAATTPGLQPAIAAPMTAWSLDATKLLVKMGLHGGGNALDATATELNAEATNAQSACAAAGTHA